MSCNLRQDLTFKLVYAFLVCFYKTLQLLICSLFASWGSSYKHTVAASAELHITSDENNHDLSLENCIFMCCRHNRRVLSSPFNLTRKNFFTANFNYFPLTWSCKDYLWAVPRCHQSRHNKGPPVRSPGLPTLWPCSIRCGLGMELPQCPPPQWFPLSAPGDGHTGQVTRHKRGEETLALSVNPDVA